MGGVTVVFTLVHSVLLEPLPYPHADRLVRLTQSYADDRFAGWRQVNPADFLDIQRQAAAFEMLAAYRDMSHVFDREDRPYAALVWSATPEVFAVFGVHPILGRGFVAEDALPGSPAVAVIGYDLWQGRFGGDTGVIGQRIGIPPIRGQYDKTLDMTVVGVLPDGFQPPVGGTSVADITAYPAIWTNLRFAATPDRRSFSPFSLTVVGRLRPGIRLNAARAELNVLLSHLGAEHPTTSGERTTVVTSLREEVVGRVQTILWIFFGAVACVLLIAVANLTSLQLVRNAAREREIIMRAALGASRWRLVRQLLVESVMLGMAGGALGLLLAWIGTRAVVASLPARFPRASEIDVDGTVLLFVCAVSALVGLVFGLIPAWRASRPDLAPAVSERSRSATMSAHRARTQRLLIATETAVALVLLAGAGLLINSFYRLVTVDAGMDERRLWNVTIDLPVTYRSDDEGPQLAFWRSALDAVRVLPHVESAALAMLPLSGGGIILPARAEGAPESLDDQVQVSYRPVSGDYFRTAGIRVLEGRPILATDTAGAEPVVVLNQQAARSTLPGEDPIGKRIVVGRTTLTVVGLVPDFRHSTPGEEIQPQMYTSYVQRGLPVGIGVTGIVVRLAQESAGFAEAVRTAVMHVEQDAEISLASVTGMRWRLLAEERFRTAILVIFASTATLLAVIGIFGVVGYSVVQRHREVGIRMALGATAGSVTRLMARQALTPVAIGLAFGLAGSFLLTGMLSSFLYEVQPHDPVTIAGALLFLAVTAGIGSLVPARKAARVNPAITLQCE